MEDETTCEMPDFNPPEQEIRKILNNMRTVAIVGLSDKSDRDSNKVGAYLKGHGYKIIPVNPSQKEILGEKSYPDLASVPEKIDVVDIFRSVDAIPAIVDEAIAAGAGAVWMQLGLAHRESAGKARSAGLKVVQSRCIKIEHSRMKGKHEFNLKS
ncbi:MAG TPA: CoA-binding protein [Spirochaetota bacterium]|nr:CoA-binding protein [Spirochaetota bacterium]